MPLYEFACKDCKVEYTELIAMSDYNPEGGFPGVECPSCGSPNKNKLMSVCSFAFANPVGTDRYENSHDYRYKHKAPGVAAERSYAASQSHVGPDPYSHIDDISSGNHFGDNL